MVEPLVVGAVAGGFLLRLLRRRKQKDGRVNNPNDVSVEQIDSTARNFDSDATGLEADPITDLVDLVPPSEQLQLFLGWEHLLAVVLLGAALGLCIRKEAYTEAVLVGLAVLLLLVAQLVRDIGSVCVSHALCVILAPACAAACCAPRLPYV